MSEKASSYKKAKEAFVEDLDPETGEGDPSTRKSAKSLKHANSALKRAVNKSPEFHQSSQRASQHAAGDTEDYESGHDTDDAAENDEKPAKSLPKDEVSSSSKEKRRYSIRTHSTRDDRLRSPEKKPSKEGRPRSSEKRPSRTKSGRSEPCDCWDCALRHGRRPGPLPLQQHGYHPVTYPYPPIPPQGPPALIRDNYPGGYLPPQPRPRAGTFTGGRPSSFHPGLLPGYHGTNLHPLVGGYFDAPYRLPTNGAGMPAFDPRSQAPYGRAGPPPHLGRPNMPIPPRTLPSPVRLSTRPTLNHKSESYSTRVSNPEFGPKISTYDLPPGKDFDDEEHISARELPLRSRTMSGQYDSSSGSSESSPTRPPIVPLAPPSRPPLTHYATTSAIRPAYIDPERSKSAAVHYLDRQNDYSRDYLPDKFDDYDRRSDQYGSSWERYSDRGPRDYERTRRPLLGRRDSISSEQTQPTSYSNPEYRTVESRSGRRARYRAHEPRHTYHQQRQREDDVNAYQDRMRGYSEKDMEAIDMRAAGGRPPSNLSHRSPRSPRSHHSGSETSSRYTKTADGGFKITMPMSAAGDTGINFAGDMADRQISWRPNAGQVELVISGPSREVKYYKSTSSAGRSAVRSKFSTGSSRNATRGRGESRDPDHEREAGRREDRRQSRAPSSLR